MFQCTKVEALPTDWMNMPLNPLQWHAAFKYGKNAPHIDCCSLPYPHCFFYTQQYSCLTNPLCVLSQERVFDLSYVHGVICSPI